MQAPGDPFIPLPPAGDVLGNAATFKVDYEDVANNQGPTQEARIENLQQFLSNQGFQVCPSVQIFCRVHFVDGFRTVKLSVTIAFIH